MPAAPVLVPVTDPAVVQLDVRFGVSAITRPVGNDAPITPAVAETSAVELSATRLSVDTPPRAILLGARDCAKVGCAAAVVVSVAVAMPLLPRDDVKSPYVFTNDPTDPAVTSTL